MQTLTFGKYYVTAFSGTKESNKEEKERKKQCGEREGREGGGERKRENH